VVEHIASQLAAGKEIGIVAAAAENGVVARSGGDLIVGGVAVNHVVEGAADDIADLQRVSYRQRRQEGWVDDLQAGVRKIDDYRATKLRKIESVGTRGRGGVDCLRAEAAPLEDKRIIAGPGNEQVVAGARLNRCLAGACHQGVVAAGTVDVVVCAAADNVIVSRCADDLLESAHERDIQTGSDRLGGAVAGREQVERDAGDTGELDRVRPLLVAVGLSLTPSE